MHSLTHSLSGEPETKQNDLGGKQTTIYLKGEVRAKTRDGEVFVFPRTVEIPLPTSFDEVEEENDQIPAQLCSIRYGKQDKYCMKNEFKKS